MKYRIKLMILLAAAICSCQKDKYVANVKELKLVNVLPSSGYSGQIVKILGRNFSPEEGGNVVTFGGKTAKVLDYNEWDLTVVLPKNDPGEYEVQVTTKKGSIGGLNFAYIEKPEHSYLRSIYAGVVGSAGRQDGQGTAATFAQPEGVTLAPDGSLYIFQRGAGNFAIRHIDKSVNVTTVTTDAQLSYPWHGDVASDGTMYFANKGNHKILKCTSSGVVSEQTISGATLNNPMECKFDNAGNMYIANRNADEVILTAGGVALKTWTIPMPTCMAPLPDGRVVVGTNSSGYLYIIKDTTVSKIAGCGSINSSLGNGTAGDLVDHSAIGFTGGLCADSQGAIYIGDITALSVRKITPDASGDYSKGKLETISEGLYASDVALSADEKKIFVTCATSSGQHTVQVIEIF